MNRLSGVALRAANDGWAVGSGGTILRLDAGSWSAVASPTAVGLADVATTPSGGAWAVGQGIFRWDGVACTNFDLCPNKLHLPLVRRD